MFVLGLGPREAWSLGMVESMLYLRARLSLYSKAPSGNGEPDRPGPSREPKDLQRETRPDGSVVTHIRSLESMAALFQGRL